MSDMRDSSKKSWTSADSVEHINVGSLQRIADACELMAKNHARLIYERDQFEQWYKDERNRRQRTERVVIALRGVITKLKRKAGS